MGSILGCSACDEASTTNERIPSSPQEIAFAPVYARPAPPTAYYEPPAAHVLYVATNGNDASGTGAAASPYQTLGKALQVANGKPAGPTWTIVMRGGTYREGQLTVTRNDITIQRYKSEVVYLLGSTALAGFSGSGPYTLTVTSVDTAPLEQSCADDSLLGGTGRHYGSESPFALFRDGIPLQRVSQAVVPASGQYTYDPAYNVVTLADPPSQIELASKLFAIMSKASNVKIAGLDIEGYATCVVHWKKVVGGHSYYNSPIVFYKDAESESGGVLENSTVANNAAGGVMVARAHHVRISGNTIVNNGWTGVYGSDSDDLTVYDNSISYNNVRRWDNSGRAGMNVTHGLRGVIFNNVFERNASSGFWCDQGCGTNDANQPYVIARNVLRYNEKNGILYEVSHDAVIASNVAHDNGESGIALSGSRSIDIWNNTAVDNNAADVSIVDDSRCVEGDTLPGGKICSTATGTPLQPNNPDHCEPRSNGALANTCNAENVRLVNNILSGSGGARSVLTVVDGGKSAYGAARVVARDEFQVYEDNSLERTDGAVHPFFVDRARKNFAQNTASPTVWGRGAPLPTTVLKAIYWPSTSPAQPSARIGAVAWAAR
ncbi:right-handed parallel beta-helix repeat-containing protein [Pendulispora brunnea]|uniref:Right-handed parallel beta-helix repeat-containing protein n=1 Tax=Pendulispora brunnea TaxID=2905690 RepID=A0ABZ2K7X1_9BACT